MTIGEKLKKSRNDKGMSLRELATKVELSASFLSQIEQGKASPSIENLKKIAHTIDVRVAYLIEDEEDDIRNIEFETFRSRGSHSGIIRVYQKDAKVVKRYFQTSKLAFFVNEQMVLEEIEKINLDGYTLNKYLSNSKNLIFTRKNF